MFENRTGSFARTLPAVRRRRRIPPMTARTTEHHNRNFSMTLKPESHARQRKRPVEHAMTRPDSISIENRFHPRYEISAVEENLQKLTELVATEIEEG